MTETRKLDLITFEVLRHRLWEINDEMAMLAARISRRCAESRTNGAGRSSGRSSEGRGSLRWTIQTD